MRIPALSASLALIAFSGSLLGQEAPNLETAVLPLPKELRADATILILTETREFEVLRPGSNGFFCIADQPGDDRFSANCHPESLRTFLVRRRSFPSDARAERDSVLTSEILAGLMAVPSGALSWYMQGDINEETGVPDEVTVWNELTAPFATTEATGMGTVDAGAVPWLMSAGRYSAHIMVRRRTVPWSAQDQRRCDYHDPVWSPSGDRVVFYSNRSGNFQVYTIRPDGTDLRQLTYHEGQNTGPSWSPDGHRLVFVSDRTGQGTLHLANADGSGVQLVSPDLGRANSPRWSPDGRLLVYEGRTEGNRDIYAIDLEELDIRRLTTDPANDFRPVVSPDGQWLAFQSNRSGTYQLYRVPLAGGEPQVVTVGPANHAGPSWSPDGERLAFMSDRGGNEDIFHMSLGDTSTIRVTSDSALDHAPSWSPDGMTIAFVSWRTGRAAIFLVGADGSRPTLLIDGCARH